MKNNQLTSRFKGSLLGPPFPTVSKARSQQYAFLSQQPVTSSSASVENNTQDTGFASWRGEPMDCGFSRFHNRAVPSNDALARIRPFGDMAMSWTRLVWPVKHAIWCQVVVFQILIDLSYEPEMSVLPHARQYTVPECPLRMVHKSLPVFASQILMNASSLLEVPAVAIIVMSGEYWAAHTTLSPVLISSTTSPFSTSHTLAVPSQHPLSTRLESRLQHTDSTLLVCPAHVATTFSVSMFHSVIVPSLFPVTTFFSSGDNAMAFTPRSPSRQTAICCPLCKAHTRWEPSEEQVMICCLPGRFITPLIHLICPSNFWQGLMRVACNAMVVAWECN